MNTQSPLEIQTFYPNSPNSSSDLSSRESMMNTPMACNSNLQMFSPFSEYSENVQVQDSSSSQHEHVQEQYQEGYEQQYASQGYQQQFEPTNSSSPRTFFCPYPPATETIKSPFTPNIASTTAAPLPAITNLMKEVHIKEEFNEYYANPTMNDYRVEKIANPLADPYIHIEQPTYAEFANAPMLNQQDMINQMPFSANYMGATQFSQPVQLNLLDLNFTGFGSINSCDSALPLMHQSPSQQAYVMPHSTFTPPPQDPLVADQKPLGKKRMAAVQCHQNSICSNCKTRETTLWRRNTDGGVECNACNLYFRKNNRKRPLALRKDGIMKRNRRPRNESPNGPLRKQATC